MIALLSMKLSDWSKQKITNSHCKNKSVGQVVLEEKAAK
jgi:hypothetical protein